MRIWRNWQTRTVQVRVKAISCRFKSCYPHQKKDQLTCELVFFQRCVPQAERDVPLGRDVCFASDVRFAREEAEHITSLCDEGAIHHCAIALHHFGAADTSLKNVRVRSHTLKRQKYLFCSP